MFAILSRTRRLGQQGGTESLSSLSSYCSHGVKLCACVSQRIAADSDPHRCGWEDITKVDLE